MKRRELRERPFPGAWVPYLEEYVAFWRACPDHLGEKFKADLKLFLWEKAWIPAGGIEITEAMQVVVSAAAARLILHLDISLYNRLTEIVMYPSHYKHPGNDTDVILGEAHNFGTVVLSWDAVRHGLANNRDGHDTATHEFAHVLDRGDGAFDGTPTLRSRADYKAWADVMSRHFLALRDEAAAERSVLRMYGATNEAEFFAVVTEAFFERPAHLKEALPDLYVELRRFYGFDPCS